MPSKLRIALAATVQALAMSATAHRASAGFQGGGDCFGWDGGFATACGY